MKIKKLRYSRNPKNDWDCAVLNIDRQEIGQRVGEEFDEIEEDGLGKYWTLRFAIEEISEADIVEIYATRHAHGAVVVMDIRVASPKLTTQVLTTLGFSNDEFALSNKWPSKDPE